jgi:hypothetical protein
MRTPGGGGSGRTINPDASPFTRLTAGHDNFCPANQHNPVLSITALTANIWVVKTTTLAAIDG